EHGILELEIEAVRGADAALGGEGAAEHGAAVGELPAFKTARDEVGDREHRIERALLVEHALALDGGPGAQDHPVPMADHVLELPQRGGDRLVAHLLRHGDAVGLNLAVGVVGAAADEDAALPADQYELDLAGGIAAGAFDAVFLGEPSCRAAI